VVILLYDQLLFRPLVVWSQKFHSEQNPNQGDTESWVLRMLRASRVVALMRRPFAALLHRVVTARWTLPLPARHARWSVPTPVGDWVWRGVIVFACVVGAWSTVRFVGTELGWADVGQAIGVGFLTLIRVVVLIAIASVIWVPIGVFVGLRPSWTRMVQPVAQVLAAFPANLMFPVVVVLIAHFHASPNIWLSPLMVLGTQWYILFNVIAGASAFPADLRDAATNLGVRGWMWWRRVILPGVFPYYVTGGITASGGSWNASIVAETVSWGPTHYSAVGLGSYIAAATEAADYPRVVLGIAVMAVYVTAFNRLLWRPLYAYSERRLRIQ
jgi:NitT/TauT family transport system permease protein